MLQLPSSPPHKKNWLAACIACLCTLQIFAQAPVISSFTPASGPVGTTVTITGSNFSATPVNNIVYFGAVRATVSAASPGSLTVTVPVGATYQPISITTNNLTAYSMQPFVATFAGAGAAFTLKSFTRIDSISGVRPNGIAVADFDGDGKPDLATANSASPVSNLSVFRNTGGAGTVSLATKIDLPAASGAAPYSIAAGDIDGDGLQDIVVVNLNRTVSVYRNTSTTGNISFATQVDFNTGINPYSIAIGDLDGDGKPDMVVANFLSNTLSIYKNTSTPGTVSFATRVDLATALAPHTVAIGDLDGDGKPDLAVTNSLSYSFSVFKNQSTAGAITFAPRVDFTSGTDEPFALAIGDLDGDGKPDVAITNDNFNLYGTASVLLSVFRNTSTAGAIAFTGRVDYGSGNIGYNVTIGDLNGDGLPDLVVPNALMDLSVYRNISTPGTLSFAGSIDYYSASPYSAVTGDLDGDSLPDIAAVNFSGNTISVFKSKVTSPAILSFTPTAAIAGTTITITGVNFTGATAVSFGGVAATSFTVVSSTTITAVVGTGASGNISVTTPKATATLAGFNFVFPPVISSFTPAAGGTGATITITGTSFTGATSVSFGGMPARSFTVVSPTTITAVVDTGATGNVSVTTNPGGTATLAGFTYTGPSIASFNPSSGIVGSTVTITGSNFTGATSVSFGGVPSSSFTVVSPTSITAVVGQGNTGNVQVITPNGATSLGVFTFIGPVISSFTPITGNTGITITIRGINFTGATAVSFGGIPAASFTVLSPDSIVAVLAAGASGNVSVTTPDGTATMPGFTFSTTLPVISSISPATAGTGAAITIQGANFGTTAAANTVYFGAAKAVVSAASASTLTVTAPAGATYRPVILTTHNLTASSSQSFDATFPGGSAAFTAASFGGQLPFPSAGQDFAITLGDLDGDGKSDVVVANYSGFVSVFGNNGMPGTISFLPKVVYASGVAGATITSGITIADLDGDGKPELIIASINPDNVSVFRNTSTPGAISFAARADFPIGHGPFSTAAADLDGDGKPDLVVTDMYNNSITVLKNTSTVGTVSFAAGIDFATGQYPKSIAITDLDGDGKADLAIANGGSYSVASNTISIFRNTSTGSAISFEPKKDFIVGFSPCSVAAGDLDGDGKPDLAVANNGSASISVLANNSTGGVISFRPKTDYAAGNGTAAIDISDLNGDGKPDVAAGNSSTSLGTISVFSNTSTPGAIAFAAKVDYGTELYNPQSIVAGDLDGDGKPELTTINFGSTVITVFKNKINDFAPTVTAGGATTFCSGVNVTLTSTAANNQWYKDGVAITGATNTTFTVTASGTYTATTVTGAGTSTPSAAVIVTVIAVPPTPTITPGAVGGLVSSSASGNQWYMDTTTIIGGATAQTWQPNLSGYYSVKTTQNGCSSPFSARYYYLATATIDLGAPGTYLRIAPNPVNDFVGITYNFPGITKLNVELSDLDGRIITMKSNVQSGGQLNTSGLTAGMYILKVYSSNGKINVATSIIKL